MGDRFWLTRRFIVFFLLMFNSKQIYIMVKSIQDVNHTRIEGALLVFRIKKEQQLILNQIKYINVIFSFFYEYEIAIDFVLLFKRGLEISNFKFFLLNERDSILKYSNIYLFEQSLKQRIENEYSLIQNNKNIKKTGC